MKGKDVFGKGKL